jgi:transketolase
MKDEDDDLRELNELLQQYAEATTEERKHLRPDVERAISKVSPSLMDTADTRFVNGDYLKDMFDQCMKRVLARSDLAPDRKTNAREEQTISGRCSMRQSIGRAPNWQRTPSR